MLTLAQPALRGLGGDACESPWRTMDHDACERARERMSGSVSVRWCMLVRGGKGKAVIGRGGGGLSGAGRAASNTIRATARE